MLVRPCFTDARASSSVGNATCRFRSPCSPETIALEIVLPSWSMTAIAIRRPSLKVEPVQVPLLAVIGIGDMLGNFFFAAASSSGLVSITSVLASLYPIVTVVLARIVLGERVARSQEAGVALTLAGVALISVG